MIRHHIVEPNFTTIFSGATRHLPAELNIILMVHLSPMDPTHPYTAGRWHTPPIYRLLFPPALVKLLSTPKVNLNFHTHLAGSPQQIRRGTVADSEETKFKARSWMPREFEEYKVKFKQVVELCWNNQIILLPPDDPKDGLSDDDYMEFVGNPGVPAHLVCSLTIFLTQNQQGANAAIQVARLDRDEAVYATRRDVMSLPGEGQFGSYMVLITNEDVYRRDTTSYRWQNVRMSQITAAHEVGHWLGRPVPADDPDRFFVHVDAARYPKTHPHHGEMQYGGTAGRRLALMGGGSLATLYEAGPWLNRARRHTRTLSGWRFVHRARFVGMVPVSARQRQLTGRP